MNLNRKTGREVSGRELFIMAATLVAISSCATRELPPPDGWVAEQPQIQPLKTQTLSTQTQNTQTLNTQAVNPETGIVAANNLNVDQQKLLDSHNSIRERLGIPPLRWSTRLESFAADWANFLTTEADCQPRRRGSVGLPQNKRVGENLQLLEPVRFGDGRTEAAAIDERKVVLEWVREGIEFNYDDNKCGVGKNCDNYTQVVWRDSQVMGCAAASCADQSQIWVCNYDPPGNFFGQKPY